MRNEGASAAQAERVAEEVAEAYLLAFGVMGIHPGAWRRRGRGAAVSVSGLPFANFNGVFVHGPEADADEVRGMLGELDASGFPYSLKMRPGVRPEVEALARERGFEVAERLPLMAVSPEAFRPSRPTPLKLGLLPPTEPAINTELVAHGLGSPVEVIAAFLSPSNRASADWRVYLGTVGGSLAATGTAIRCGDHASLAAIATDPGHRRKGYAADLTSRMVSDAYAGGARRVFLHSSEMGYGIYESLGFQLLEHWSIWAPTS